jgi:multicomponent Na+:H+ antiporter subunit B
MKHPIRLSAFAIFGAALAGLFCWALWGLEAFGAFTGPYGIYFNRMTVALRHVTNVPAAINFDFRAIDTMGEEYILFGAVLGTLVLLRQLEQEQEMEESEPDRDVGIHQISEPSDAVRLMGLLLTGLLTLFGMYVVLHGQLTPGGGFQGGTIMGTAALLVFLTTGYQTYSRIAPSKVWEFLDAAGAGGYVAVGLAGIVCGNAFLANVIPFGQTGHFASGGTLTLLNDLVGLEVANGFAVVFNEFIVQTRRKG